MEIVADASAFLAVVLNEGDRDWVIHKTTGKSIISPEVLPYEIGNVLIAMRRKGRPNKREILQAFDLSQRSPSGGEARGLRGPDSPRPPLGALAVPRPFASAFPLRRNLTPSGTTSSMTHQASERTQGVSEYENGRPGTDSDPGREADRLQQS